MRRRKRTRARVALACACVLALAAGGTGGWAYTAANTIASGGRAGQGSAAISAFTISSVAYALNANSPQNIDQVAFTLSPTSAKSAKAQLVTGGTWYGCTNAAGNVTCSTTAPQGSASTANNLTIVAAQ
jgi:hypothetical protein